MAELSQFLNTGSVKTVSLQSGTIDRSSTGVKLTVTATSTQKVIFTPQIVSSTSGGNVTLDFGGRNVYTGDAVLFKVSSIQDFNQLQNLVGGKGENLTFTVNQVGGEDIKYFVQVVEID